MNVQKFCGCESNESPQWGVQANRAVLQSKMEGSHPDKLTVSTEKLLNDLSSENFKSFSKIKLDKKPLLW
jgi:hypothetical protein